MSASSWPHERAAAIAEEVLVTLLAIVLALQLLAYPATDDADPAGYVSYAAHLNQTFKLQPDSPRLPGYPAFLALVSKIGGEPLGVRVYWVQAMLCVVGSLIGWRVVRQQLGPLPALILLGIIAAPSYLAQMSAVMLPDGLYTLLWVPVFLGVGWWAMSDDPPGDWLLIIPLGLGLFVLQAIRPGTITLAILFVPCMMLAIWLTHGRESEYGIKFRWGVGAALSRVAAFLAVALLVAVGSDRLLDTGARAYNLDLLAYRAVIFLPPAANTPADERIEAAKAHFREAEGQPIEQARFLTYPSFAYADEIKREDVREVWRGRLAAHPVQYVGSVLDNLRLTQYLITRRLVPYFLDVARLPLLTEPFPRDDGSPASTLFRRTGLLVSDQQPPQANASLGADTTRALLRLFVVWGLAAVGVWQLGRLAPHLTIALGMLGLLFVLTLAATSTVDSRELLPFVPLVYLAQAVGLTWIIEAMVSRSR